VGLSGPQQPCPTPARPRAPLAAVGGKARANNRGLAGKETAPVMEEFWNREKERFASSPRVSLKFNGTVSPLVVKLRALRSECRKSITFATLGEGRAGVSRR